MKDSILKIRNSSIKYRLNSEYGLTENLLAYIKTRIEVNKKEIIKLIDLKKENIIYEDILSLVNEIVSNDIEYKSYKNMAINNDGFLYVTMLMPIGVVAVETFDTMEVIRYLFNAIKSRNAIVISDVEYDEYSVKFLILEILKEALKKFELDEELINIYPYEECFYKYFDRVIYTYDKFGNKLLKEQYNDKEYDDKKYVYIEDTELESFARFDNGRNVEYLYGKIDDVIGKINSKYSSVAVIYTKNTKHAYKFINLVLAKNVFVNASIRNENVREEYEDSLYVYKNVILPIPKQERKEIFNDVDVEKMNGDNVLGKSIDTENMMLEVINESVVEKIKKFLRKIFFKK